MKYTGQNIIDRAQKLLVEEGAGVTWPVADLVLWLNDGRSTMYRWRPELYQVTADVSLVAGTLQTLPNGATRLLRPVANVTHPRKRAIDPASDESLSAYVPTWRSAPQSNEILHVVYAPRDREQYEVYPPAKVGTQITLTYADPPAALTTGTLATVLQEGEEAEALVDFVVARAMERLSETLPALAARAAVHDSLFYAKLGVQAARTGGQ